jgi:diguanylate cyclase (GGDEF)-like protein/PAS domain S-box-containing protein
VEASIRLLIIEDSEDDAALLGRTLRQSGYEVDSERVDSARDLVQALKRKWDIIISDHSMPHFSGNEALKIVRKLSPEVPFIFVSGTIGEEAATEAMRVGAQDYVLKTNLKRLVPAVQRELREVENRSRLKEQVQSDQIILNSIGEAVLSTDISGTVTYLNRAAERMTGWSCKEAAGRPMAEVFRILDATSRRTTLNPIQMEVGKNRPVQLRPNCILIRRDGLEMPIEVSVSPLHDRRGQVSGAVTVVRDVTAARAMSLQMTHSALHDVLTGLPNRMLLIDRVNRAIALASLHMKKFAVLFLDLDGFKHINDSLGHPVGDKLLQSVAKRLADCVCPSDTISRQGGDEFVVLLQEVDQPDEAATMARRILEAVAGAHSVGQHNLHVTTSIGLSVYPDDGLDAETLIKNSDTAMYQAKENGRQTYEFFTPAMNVRAVERQSIEESLRHALERQEFTLNYQPMVNLKSGAITGIEALIRWRHPRRGLLYPPQFISVAEEFGLIVPIGCWVLREGCRQAKAWQDSGLPLMRIAINISAVELRAKTFVEGVRAILRETGLEPRCLELELTETFLMQDTKSTAVVLHALKNMGVTLALDDFGTGYSSLSYVRRFPIDTLKIDYSFVRNLATDADDASVVSAVINMGKSLHMRVVAEGIETPEQLLMLREQRCPEGQGFYFSHPVVAEEIAPLFQRDGNRLHS